MGLQRVGHQQFFFFFFGLILEHEISEDLVSRCFLPKRILFAFSPSNIQEHYQSDISLAPPKGLNLMSV